MFDVEPTTRTAASGRGRRRQLLAAALAVAAAAAVVTSVLVAHGARPSQAASSSRGGTTLSIGTVPVVTALDQVTLPLDRVLPTASQDAALFQLAESRQNSCLTSHGYAATSVPTDYAAYIQQSYRDFYARSYVWGFFDTQSYKTEGYRRPPGVPGQIVIPGPSADVPSEVASACKTQADATYSGVLLNRDSVPSFDLRQVSGNPLVVSAASQWSLCMRNSGYDFKNPNDVFVSQPQQPVQPSTGELAQASHDIECKISSNLVGISVAVETAYETSLLSSASVSSALSTSAAQVKTLLGS